MTPPKEAWQEYPLESDPQNSSAGPSPQATSRVTSEVPAPYQGTEASSDTKIPFTREGAFKIEVTLQGGQSHQVSHRNGVKNPTGVNLESAIMAPPSG